MNQLTVTEFVLSVFICFKAHTTSFCRCKGDWCMLEIKTIILKQQHVRNTHICVGMHQLTPVDCFYLFLFL